MVSWNRRKEQWTRMEIQSSKSPENKSIMLYYRIVINRRELEKQQAREAYIQRTIEGKTVLCLLNISECIGSSKSGFGKTSQNSCSTGGSCQKKEGRRGGQGNHASQNQRAGRKGKSTEERQFSPKEEKIKGFISQRQINLCFYFTNNNWDIVYYFILLCISQ